MTIKEAIQHLGSQTGYAFALTVALLIALEWLMPGSVLPFVNIISLIPLSLLVVVALITIKSRRKNWLNIINIAFGAAIALLALISLFTFLPWPGLRTILLIGAILSLISVWAYSMHTEN